MKKAEIKELIRAAIEPRSQCRVYFWYDANYWYYFPLLVGEKLFLGAEEDDFILDGFSVRRFRDVERVEIKDDKCRAIIAAEGLLDGLTAPPIDITDWHSVFLSLEKMGKNIIVENENIVDEHSDFAIGKVVKVLKDKVRIKEFDADGVWVEELLDIPFSQITSVTFGSRYVEVFSKYLDEDTEK